MPQFVIDAPGGGGKVPINPDYIKQLNGKRVIIRNFENKVFEYPENEGAKPQFHPAHGHEIGVWKD